MRLIKLLEKLEKFEIVNPGEKHSFDDTDNHLINTGSYPKRIQNAFSNTTFPFEIFIVNQSNDEEDWIINQDNNTNVMSPNYVKNHIYSNFRHNKNVITLILTNNFADNKHPLTPWIVAHRFAHVIESANRTGKRTSRFNSTVKFFMQQIVHVYNKNNFYIDEHDTYYEIVEMMTTKSATNPKPDSRIYTGEADHELLTQFIINGRISLKTDHFTEERYGNDRLSSDMITVAKQFEKRLNKEAANDLSRAIGKIFVI